MNKHSLDLLRCLIMKIEMEAVTVSELRDVSDYTVRRTGVSRTKNEAIE
jgi:hypothetical protein